MYIARVFGSCFLCFGLVGSVRAQSPDYSTQLSQILSALNGLALDNNDIMVDLNAIEGVLGNMASPNGYLLSEAEYNYRMDELMTALTYNQSVSNRRNILSLLDSIAASSKSLAANAWWATNSAFANSFAGYSAAFPDDGLNSVSSYSFPEFLSLWSGRLQTRASNPTSALANNGWYSLFGQNDFNALSGASSADKVRRGYTWFDWVTDMMRSNAVVRDSLAAYASQAEAEQYLTSLDESTAEEFATNAPPQVDEFEIEMPPGLDGFQTVSGPFEDFISDLTPSLTGADSEITVLPAFTIGGISTQAYKFDFNNSIVPYCRAVMSFLWAVLCGAMMFRLLSGEWAYYCSLGRTSH